ncbi:hypothetical protein SAMN05414139_05390 [Burkholderia sp. D7]|nr:hypothetical protein SAMN05414139_05390 [Burkholderia sp. D7]
MTINRLWSNARRLTSLALVATALASRSLLATGGFRGRVGAQGFVALRCGM